jgi:hypothetical protein
MHSDCCFCGYCREENKNFTGLDVPDGQWLEEMGDMIEAAVEGLRKVQSFSACLYERVATA